MKKALCLLMFVSTFSAQANIVCRGNTPPNGEPVVVEIAKDEKEVTVSGGYLNTPRVFKNLSIVHELITAPGLAVTYSNRFFGCIRNVTVITAVDDSINASMQILNFEKCSGGTTSDELCDLD